MGKTRHDQDKLPGRCEELVRLMPPQAIADDIQLDNTIEMIDRIMAIAKLTKGQTLYLETLTQLAHGRPPAQTDRTLSCGGVVVSIMPTISRSGPART